MALRRAEKLQSWYEFGGKAGTVIGIFIVALFFMENFLLGFIAMCIAFYTTRFVAVKFFQRLEDFIWGPEADPA
ncbi:MAG TPA: hypothetical protein VKO45_08385 [Methanomicrobiales archaeon]|nr:hypothetical protein [Methanomicrobiales archaeon]